MAKCSEPKCTAECKDHKWGRMKAQRDGWFFKMDGTEQWCPDHVPSWVHGWRARNRQDDGQ